MNGTQTRTKLVARPIRPRGRSARQKGSAYLIVLGAALLVATIGVTSLLAARVQRRSANSSADAAQAREMARSAIDLGLGTIKDNPLDWRALLAADPYTGVAFNGGYLRLIVEDPADSNLLNNDTDPVRLKGVGVFKSAGYGLQVTLDGDGVPQAGTWQRFVNP